MCEFGPVKANEKSEKSRDSQNKSLIRNIIVVMHKPKYYELNKDSMHFFHKKIVFIIVINCRSIY